MSAHWLKFSTASSASSKPPGMQSSIFGACPKPGQFGRVAAGRASGVKLGDDGA